MLGDFILDSRSAGASTMVDNVVNVHGLSQIVSALARGNTLLNLVFLSTHYTRGVVINIAPIAGFDHIAANSSSCLLKEDYITLKCVT